MPLWKHEKSPKVADAGDHYPQEQKRPGLFKRILSPDTAPPPSQKSGSQTDAAPRSEDKKVPVPTAEEVKPLPHRSASTSSKSSKKESKKSKQEDHASHEPSDALAKDDLKLLFSGAPHFLLEKGRHGVFYPQIFFPWDREPHIGDLNDRRPLRHDAFTACTLHAHLPVPDEQDGHYTLNRIPKNEEKEKWKRPPFDIGVFEVPNMLGYHGKEPGTIGMRHFLELPCADAFRTGGNEHHDKETKDQPYKHFASLSAVDAVKAMKNAEEAAAVGKHSKIYNRDELICGGPEAWKKIGIRDVTKKTIIERMTRLEKLYDAVIKVDKFTVLDFQSTNELYSELFSNLLYLPSKPADMSDPYSLKNQIEALVKILATRGAWYDFSLVEWRIRLGQVLWELPTHSPDPAEEAAHKEAIQMHHAQRKWLLLQILLACELLARLDAAIRLGIASPSDKMSVTAEEIHHFNHLRSRKVDWDLVLARRYITYVHIQHLSAPLADLSTPEHEKQLTNWIREKLLRERSNISKRHPSVDHTDITAECFMLPRRGKQQIDGLIKFAKGIGWPHADEFEKNINAKLQEPPAAQASESIYGTPLHSPAATNGQANYFDTIDTGIRKRRKLRRTTLLHAAPNGSGGWLSRTWLTGLVLPGEAINHVLIATLLEHDPEVLSKIGESAALCGGFVLGGNSWWSKSCIVGRAIACLDGTNESMGWIGTRMLPLDASGKALTDGWVEVEASDVPVKKEKPRIHDGSKVAVESSPMGVGQGTIVGKEFTLPMESGCPLERLANKVEFKHITLHDPTTEKALPSASATFATSSNGDVTFNLKYDVYFITAFPCRPPPGHTVHSPTGHSPLKKRVSTDHAPTHRHSETHYPVEHLPAHPLHKTYSYVTKHIEELKLDEPPPSTYHKDKDGNEDPMQESEFGSPWVIDARGGKEREAFVRAWCAHIGVHALVARMGKSCLSCTVREAKAVDVGVIIRVGDPADGIEKKGKLEEHKEEVGKEEEKVHISEQALVAEPSEMEKGAA